MQALSNKTKWSFSIGCIGRDMNFVLVALFLMTYVQFTMNLTVVQFSVVAGIVVFARVLDAITDPMMGMIIENVRLKGGKYRPWILIGGVLNFFALLTIFSFRPEGWAFVAFFAVAYIAWSLTFTINDISYYSLIPNLTVTNESRNQLTILVQVFASIGQFVAGGLIPELVTGDAVFMYKVVGISIAFIFLACSILTYLGVTENEENNTETQEKIGFKKMYQVVKNNDQLVVSAIALLLFSVASQLFLTFAMNYFYFQFGYDGNLVFQFTLTFAVGTLFALAFFSWFSKSYSRMSLFRVGMITAFIGYLAFFAIGNIIPMIQPLLFVSSFLVFFSHGLFFVVLMIFIVNTIEYSEVHTGQRNDAIVVSLRPFMTKLGSAIQMLIYTSVLILSGVYSYSQDIADLEIKKSAGEIADITTQANLILSQASEPMKLYLTIGMSLIPLLLTLIAYFLVKKKYIIDEATFDEYVTILKER